MNIRFAVAVMLSGISLGAIAACNSASSGPSTPAAPGTVQAAIGPSGGVLTSTDGALTVRVPAGAVAGSTTFTVQPIASPPGGAIGPAYDLEPSGTTFAKPVGLTFAYATADLGGGDPRALTVATYSQGAWSHVASTVDTTGKTVAASVSHFSPWGLVLGTAPDAGPSDDATVGDAADATTGAASTLALCQAVVSAGCSMEPFTTVPGCQATLAAMQPCAQLDQCIACEGAAPSVQCTASGQNSFPGCPACALDQCTVVDAGSSAPLCQAVLAAGCSQTGFASVAACQGALATMGSCSQLGECIACEGASPVVTCSSSGHEVFVGCPACKLDQCSGGSPADAAADVPVDAASLNTLCRAVVSAACSLEPFSTVVGCEAVLGAMEPCAQLDQCVACVGTSAQLSCTDAGQNLFPNCPACALDQCSIADAGSTLSVCTAVVAAGCSQTSFSTVPACQSALAPMQSCGQLQECILCEGTSPSVTCSDAGREVFAGCPACALDQCSGHGGG